MRQRLLGVLFLVVACAAPASAQGRPATPPDTNPALTAFRRAQRLVNDGHGGPGRFVVDSLVEAAPPGSPAEAQALFWRAVIAATWMDAQRDYLRVMFEHERSPLAAEAMFRLAQGELAGGDRPAALQYLERIAREAPEAPIRGEASLWHGRLVIEGGTLDTGCPLLREGRRRVPDTQVELVNQYDDLLLRCPAEGATPPVVSPTPAPTPIVPTPSAPAASTRTPAVSPPPARPTIGPSTATQWSVQVAAYQSRAEADAMIARLVAKGYGELRVDGDAPPFRVRMGRFATKGAAQRVLAAYRTKEKADAFLAPVPAR